MIIANNNMKCKKEIILKIIIHFINHINVKFTFKCMHLADAFIQSDLQCIQTIQFFPVCVPWELNPQPTTEPQEY